MPSASASVPGELVSHWPLLTPLQLPHIIYLLSFAQLFPQESQYLEHPNG